MTGIRRWDRARSGFSTPLFPFSFSYQGFVSNWDCLLFITCIRITLFSSRCTPMSLQYASAFCIFRPSVCPLASRSPRIRHPSASSTTCSPVASGLQTSVLAPLSQVAVEVRTPSPRSESWSASILSPDSRGYRQATWQGGKGVILACGVGSGSSTSTSTSTSNSSRASVLVGCRQYYRALGTGYRDPEYG